VLSILKQHWLTVICLAILLLVAALQVNNLMIFLLLNLLACALSTASLPLLALIFDV
jgi:hypothetical protein